jgi:hypothetical protein
MFIAPWRFDLQPWPTVEHLARAPKVHAMLVDVRKPFALIPLEAHSASDRNELVATKFPPGKSISKTP